MMQENSKVIEEYLLAIYHLKQEHDVVKAVLLTNRLNTAAPTVHASVNRMQRDGLLEISPSKKELILTKKGLALAENIAYRHNLAETFLCEVLGIGWHEVHAHAHELEHAMTPLVVEKMAIFLNQPKYCPHGTPMPGVKMPKNMCPLTALKVKTKFRVLMITESLEEDEEVMLFLHQNQIKPQQQYRLEKQSSALRSMVIKHQNENTRHTIPTHIATQILVEPLQ